MWGSLKYKFSWLPVLDSPFVFPKLKFYGGPISRGTTYFFPRKWKFYTEEESIEKAQQFFDKKKEAYIKAGKEYKGPSKEEFESKVSEYKRYKKAIPKKFGCDIVGLGWKTKFDQYRHEWNPMFSFVAFNRQFCVYITTGDSMVDMCYWEAWLTYHYETDRSKSKEERVEELFKEYTCNWGNPNKGYHNYYQDILKRKYKTLIK